MNTTQEPLITYTSTEDATGDVKKVYEEMQAAFGVVPEPVKVLSLNPELLRNEWQKYQILGSNGSFSPKLGAMMRMLVGENNDCDFCTGFNKAMLINAFGVSEDEIATVQKDPTTANLDDKEKAMLLFMLKSTSNPHDVNKTDMDILKKLDWSEKEIMEGAFRAASMVSTTILVDTFKIQ